MKGFIRQPCVIKIRMLTTCCERCGCGLEVQFVPQELKPLTGQDTHTYREAEGLLDEWEQKHPEECPRSRPRHLAAV